MWHHCAGGGTAPRALPYLTAKREPNHHVPPPLSPLQVIEDRLVYENQLISTIDVQPGPRGSVTRDSVYM